MAKSEERQPASEDPTTPAVASDDGDETATATLPHSAGQGGGLTLDQVGGEVAAVLQSAHAAADEMRVAARRDAERIRSEADAAAERVVADARREAQAMRKELRELRDEVDTYAKAAREEAEAYAIETRRTAEADARRKAHEAEEMLRTARADAKRIVKEATAEGERRTAALEAEAGRFEERLANILTIFRGVAAQIQDVLEAPRPNDEAAADRDASLDEALRPTSEKEDARAAGAQRQRSE